MTDGGGTSTGHNFLRARLTSPTTIVIDRDTNGTTLDYAWEVVEFTDGTTVQSGNLNYSMFETNLTATLTSVDSSRTVAFLSGDQRMGRHTYTADDEVGPGYFTTTITNSTTLTVEREITGSVGADAAWFVLEFPPPPNTRFRSLGTDVTDLNTSARTVGIPGQTATFSGSMPDKLGIGDVLQYQVAATWYTAFIHGRTSDTVYTVRAATGGTPQAAAAGTAVNVYRAYTSLVNWEAQDENDSLNDAIENFDTSKDLIAANAVMQVAAYADGPDTNGNQVSVTSAWVTGPSNYIRIYAPVSTSEVGASQRHTGVAGTGYVRRPTQAVTGSYDVLELVKTCPARLAARDVIAGNDFSALIREQEADTVHVPDTLVVMEGVRVDHSEGADADLRAGLFAHLAQNTFQEGLAGLERSAHDLPLARGATLVWA